MPAMIGCDLFGVKGRVYIDAVRDRLPSDTAAMIQVQLTSLDQLELRIEAIEERIASALKPYPEVHLLRTVPGIGEIFAPLVWLEIGDVERFPREPRRPLLPGLRGAVSCPASLVVHYRRPGRSQLPLPVCLCRGCHASVHRLRAIRRPVYPEAFLALWREQHPRAPEQLALSFNPGSMAPEPQSLFAGGNA